MAGGVRFVGKVKSFNDVRGFGFIEPKDGGKDVFVHQTSIQMDGHRTLNEGDFVEYYVESDKKTTATNKIKASAVVLIDEAEFAADGSADEYDERVECYNCGGIGHLARDCSSKPNYECFNCHKVGHMSRQCPERKIERCYNCNGIGHMARDCVKNGSSKTYNGNGQGGDVTCYNCGEAGHMKRDCDKERVVVAAPKKKGGDVTCYNCGEAGHVKRDCDKERAVVVKKNDGNGAVVGDGKCYNCGEAGHLKRDCKKESAVGRSNGGDKRRDQACFNCGKPGHFARDCKL